MNVAGQHILRVSEDPAAVVAEDNLDITVLSRDQAAIETDVIDARKRMGVVAECVAVRLFIEQIRIRIESRGVKLFRRDQGIADFIARIAEQERDLVCAPRYPFKDHGKAVAAQNRKDESDMSAGITLPDGCGNLVDRRIVAFGSGDHSFRDADNIAVREYQFFCLGCRQQIIHHQSRKVVALANNRHADPPCNRTRVSHKLAPLKIKLS